MAAFSFIGADINVEFYEEQVIRRRPPDAFTWHGERFEVVATLQVWSETGPPRWRNSERRRQHVSSQGRDYYRVKTGCGRVFDLFYDRKLVRGRAASRWALWRELIEP